MIKRPKRGQEDFDDAPNWNHRQKKLRYLKTRRDVRKLQITLIRLRATARILITGFLIFALIKLCNLPQWYLPANILSYYPGTNLEIEGNEIVSTKQIMDELNHIKLPNKPIYLLNTTPIEKSLLKLAPVKKVYVRRFWFPARLKIVINEKTPVLAVSPNPKTQPIAIFTEDASIINRKFLPLKYSGNVFSLITYDDYIKWSPKHVEYIVYLSNLLESIAREKLVYLDFRNPDDVFAQFETIKLRLGELDRTVFKRAQRTASVLSEASKIKNDIEYIDLRWDNSVSIKLKNKDQKKADEPDKKSAPKKPAPKLAQKNKKTV